MLAHGEENQDEAGFGESEAEEGGGRRKRGARAA